MLRRTNSAFAVIVWSLQFAVARGQNAPPIKSLTPLPPGLTIPIQLVHPLRAGATAVDTPIIARTTQRILIANNHYIRHGAEILGTVTNSTTANPVSHLPARLTLRFTAMRIHGETIPLLTGVIAVASFPEVAATANPCSGATDRANPNPANWTTCQVGGDQVMRSGWIGIVSDPTMHRVGFADFHGVYSDPATPDSAPHALGVFSHAALGLYGYDGGLAVQSSGGEITFTAPRKLTLHGNDNLLLQILPPANH